MGLIAVTVDEVEDPSEDTLRSMLAGVFVLADMVLMVMSMGPGVSFVAVTGTVQFDVDVDVDAVSWFCV